MTLEILKKLIKEAKAKNSKKPVYSDKIKNGIKTFKSIPVGKLANELGVSSSFIRKTIKLRPPKYQNETKEQINESPIKLLDLSKQAVKQIFEEEPTKATLPLIRLTTKCGTTIEIFQQ